MRSRSCAPFSPAAYGSSLLAVARCNSTVTCAPRRTSLSTEKRYQARLDFYPSVEFLTAVEGVTFEEAWSDTLETTVDELTIRILSKAHLIASKASSPRVSDVQDAAALRQTGKLRDHPRS
jgi:hypothetical protein